MNPQTTIATLSEALTALKFLGERYGGSAELTIQMISSDLFEVRSEGVKSTWSGLGTTPEVALDIWLEKCRSHSVALLQELSAEAHLTIDTADAILRTFEAHPARLIDP
jgi:hypothetical protein